METIYEKYMALPIDKGLLCLEYGDIADPYFCYPVNAKPIGFEGCILYCFLPQYGEMVFACNPESCVDQNVYPCRPASGRCADTRRTPHSCPWCAASRYPAR